MLELLQSKDYIARFFNKIALFSIVSGGLGSLVGLEFTTPGSEAHVIMMGAIYVQLMFLFHRKWFVTKLNNLLGRIRYDSDIKARLSILELIFWLVFFVPPSAIALVALVGHLG